LQKKKRGGNYKQLATFIYAHDQFDTCKKYTRLIGRVLNTRGQLDDVQNTRGQLDACTKYTCPIGRVYKIHAATCFLYAICHVVIKTRG